MARTSPPAEAGRFHLLVAGGCPWSQRVTIARRLLGLQDAVGVTYASGQGEDGWEFSSGLPETLVETPLLRDIYAKSQVGGEPTVPVLIDVTDGSVALTESASILWWLTRTMEQFHAPEAPNLLPNVACGVGQFWNGTDEGLTKIYGQALHADNPVDRDLAAGRLAATLFKLDDQFESVIGELASFGETTLADVVLYSALCLFFGQGNESLPSGKRPQDLDLPRLRTYVFGLLGRPGWLVPEEEAALPQLREQVGW